MKHRLSPYTSTFHMWKDASAFFYSSHITPFHSHNTMQLILDTHSSFRFRVKEGGWKTYQTLIIKENVIHQLDTNNSVQLIIYIDCESEVATRIKSLYLKDDLIHSPQLNVFHLVNSNELQFALLSPEPVRLKLLTNKILNCLSSNALVRKSDDRILRVEQKISTSHPQEITQRSLAQMVCLSESRLRSLFRKTTGVSLHRYFLWSKIRFATNRIMSGDSVCDAAIEAGFTDGSHLTKMMLKMFSLSPSELIKTNKIKTVVRSQDSLHFRTMVHAS